MQITANIDEHGAAVLKAKTNSTNATLDVPDAEGLAADLEAALEVGRHDTFRDAYAVLIDSTGCLVKVGNGGFPIPWQHITSAVNQLRA